MLLIRSNLKFILLKLLSCLVVSSDTSVWAIKFSSLVHAVIQSCALFSYGVFLTFNMRKQLRITDDAFKVEINHKFLRLTCY